MGFFRSMLSSRSPISAIVLRGVSITPRMRHLVLGGPEVAAWLAADDKADGAANGVESPAAWVKLRPDGRGGRGYTIRQVDPREGTIGIDFALHYDGPDNGTVSDWARLARPGDRAEIKGPRDGGFHLLPDSKWIWLAADACALPAAQAIMESLPAGVEVHALLVVHDRDERQSVRSSADLHVNWEYSAASRDYVRPAGRLLADLPEIGAPGQVWMAGESDWVKSWREFWLGERRLERGRMYAKGYWKEGERGHRG
ncbi:MAG: siderophore-interacting protein [Candidatus Accumulibacter sp.]|jgi:NADPH-dependent ferric siderophore reductase|nr:siderophore-interacting protein [Accumulibacter sp.]